jgi:hypothetical protein
MKGRPAGPIAGNDVISRREKGVRLLNSRIAVKNRIPATKHHDFSPICTL